MAGVPPVRSARSSLPPRGTAGAEALAGSLPSLTQLEGRVVDLRYNNLGPGPQTGESQGGRRGEKPMHKVRGFEICGKASLAVCHGARRAEAGDGRVWPRWRCQLSSARRRLRSGQIKGARLRPVKSEQTYQKDLPHTEGFVQALDT